MAMEEQRHEKNGVQSVLEGLKQNDTLTRDQCKNFLNEFLDLAEVLHGIVTETDRFDGMVDWLAAKNYTASHAWAAVAYLEYGDRSKRGARAPITSTDLMPTREMVQTISTSARVISLQAHERILREALDQAARQAAQQGLQKSTPSTDSYDHTEDLRTILYLKAENADFREQHRKDQEEILSLRQRLRECKQHMTQVTEQQNT